jgi:hypothetical protein
MMFEWAAVSDESDIDVDELELVHWMWSSIFVDASGLRNWLFGPGYGGLTSSCRVALFFPPQTQLTTTTCHSRISS